MDTCSHKALGPAVEVSAENANVDEGDEDTKMFMEVVSMPKLTGIQFGAERTRPKAGGQAEEYGNRFVDDNGRR